MIAPTPLLPTPVTDTKWIDHDADHGVRGPIRLSEDSPPEECGRASSFGVAQQSVAQRSAPPEVLRGRASTPHSVGQRGVVSAVAPPAKQELSSHGAGAT